MSRSYTTRALLALSLLVLFYVVAMSIATGLILLPYLEWKFLHRLHFQIAIFGVVGGGLILVSLVPRFEKWEDPGPRMTKSMQPRLFAVIEDVASKMGMEMPREVYLVPEVNAFVAQKGGLLGFGGRRVMGIGVPLLAIQTVSQLRSVLAHEMGHFAGGDTKLSGLIYSTRSAMLRTLKSLHGSGFAGHALLNKPFEWMFAGYMRLTQSIARQQELVADEWSVRIAGHEAHEGALREIGVSAASFDIFLGQELEPLFGAGVQPDNVFEGFRRYRTSSGWIQARPMVEKALLAEAHDPWDSHPPLAERIASAKRIPHTRVEGDPSPAYALLSRPERVEAEFSRAFRKEGLPVVTWDRTGEAWAKLWRATAVRAQARCGAALTVAAIPEVTASPESRRSFLSRVEPRLAGYAADDRMAVERSVLSESLRSLLAGHLEAAGFGYRSLPGEPLLLERAGDVVDPAKEIEALLDEATSADAFLAKLAAWGIPPEATLPMDSDERKKSLAPAAAVRVAQGKKGALEVSFPLNEASFPHCCALCCGDVANVVAVSFQAKDSGVTLGVPVCREHEAKAHTAFTLVSADPKNDLVTISVSNKAYAELFAKVNA